MTSIEIIEEGTKKGLTHEQIQEIIEKHRTKPNEIIKQIIDEFVKYNNKNRKISSMQGIETLVDGATDTINVFVCGSGTIGIHQNFCQDAFQVGKKLAELNVAYGQGGFTERQTIMGETYFGYKQYGGKNAILIVRRKFRKDIDKELSNVQGAYVVDDITGLAKAQFLWADLIVIMPGGTGTLTETMCIIEQQLDYENIPRIILYNKKVGEICFFDFFKKQIELMKRANIINGDPFNGFKEKDNGNEGKQFIEVDNLMDLLIQIEIEVAKIRENKAKGKEQGDSGDERE